MWLREGEAWKEKGIIMKKVSLNRMLNDIKFKKSLTIHARKGKVMLLTHIKNDAIIKTITKKCFFISLYKVCK